ncbi:MAG: hypothetical protein AAGA46_05050 [Cyanobacteria bacterium P01_F01_bin.13]
MAKFYRPKLNSWVMALVLASIGLHGLVLALPMPNLEETLVEEPELINPEVIQVVTLPKLATSPESVEPPLPEPSEPPPLEELPPEPLAEEIIIAAPEILDEIEPELDVSEWEDDLDIEPEQPDIENDSNIEDIEEPTLDQRLASLDSYSNYDGTRVGNGAVTERLGEIVSQGGMWPSPLRELEQTLSAITIPFNQCISEPPGDSVSVMVEVGADGTLIGEPTLLNSAGHSVIDEKVLEIARGADYGSHHPVGETKAYSFAVQIGYEACRNAIWFWPVYG